MGIGGCTHHKASIGLYIKSPFIEDRFKFLKRHHQINIIGQIIGHIGINHPQHSDDRNRCGGAVNIIQHGYVLSSHPRPAHPSAANPGPVDVIGRKLQALCH